MSQGESVLGALKKMSKVVADTADFGLMAKYQPYDATTNPSLVLAGTKLPQYAPLIERAVAYGKRHGNTREEQLEATMDKLTVSFGVEILKIVPGRVSTEVDAKYSFDIEKSIAKAKRLIELYQEEGIDKSRIYIKLAATWEGIQAARILEKHGISCNLTLLFSFAQAVACAQAGVSLISPFVGRIYDWYKKSTGTEYVGADDPGVKSVVRIYNYYKVHGYKTIVMAASFRNTGEIIALAGCDNITISPQLLEQLQANHAALVRVLDPAKSTSEPRIPEMSHADFLFMHNEDSMAVEKLAEGIRNFNKDTRKLEEAISEKIGK